MPKHILPRGDWKPYCETATGRPTEYVSRRFGTVREFSGRPTGKKFWQAVPKAPGAIQRRCLSVQEAMEVCENPQFTESVKRQLSLSTKPMPGKSPLAKLALSGSTGAFDVPQNHDLQR